MSKLPSYFFNIILLILASITAFGIYFWHQEGLRYYSVQSDSMAPTLHVGDLIINEKTKPQNIRTGDIVSYISPDDQRVIITHRVIHVNKQTNSILTQGDNLNVADQPIKYNLILGREIKTVPSLGYILDTLHNPLGLVTLIYIPVLVIAVAELKKLANRYVYRTYKLPKHS